MPQQHHYNQNTASFISSCCRRTQFISTHNVSQVTHPHLTAAYPAAPSSPCMHRFQARPTPPPTSSSASCTQKFQSLISSARFSEVLPTSHAPTPDPTARLRRLGAGTRWSAPPCRCFWLVAAWRLTGHTNGCLRSPPLQLQARTRHESSSSLLLALGPSFAFPGPRFLALRAPAAPAELCACEKRQAHAQRSLWQAPRVSTRTHTCMRRPNRAGREHCSVRQCSAPAWTGSNGPPSASVALCVCYVFRTGTCLAASKRCGLGPHRSGSDTRLLAAGPWQPVSSLSGAPN